MKIAIAVLCVLIGAALLGVSYTHQVKVANEHKEVGPIFCPPFCHQTVVAASAGRHKEL